MGSPKTTPRFLPTLTEVVQPRHAHAAAPQVEPPLSIDVDALVDRVMLSVAPHIENQLRELVTDVVQEQLRELTPRIQHDLEVVVRAAVSGALADLPSSGL
jgi:predicted RecB family endonuclease